MNKPRTLIAILVIASAILCFFSVGASYNNGLTSVNTAIKKEKISRDSWVLPGAKISLMELSDFGNRLILEFKRRKKGGDAQVVLSLCERTVLDFTVIQNNQKIAIPLRASCEPKELGFLFKNPIKAGKKDGRELLGVRLASLKVTSSLGVPLLKFSAYLKPFFLVLILTFAAFFTLKARNLNPMHAGFIPPVFFILLAIGLFQTEKQLFLCISGFLILAAIYCSDKIIRKSGAFPEPITKLFVPLLFFFFFGFLLRSFHLGFGLPNEYHPDEATKAKIVDRMIEESSLDPKYYLHPPLLLYSTLALKKLTSDSFRGSNNTILYGRYISMLAGSLSILLMFFIGRRLPGKETTGFLAAIFLAFNPLHITCSRYMKEDSLLLFFILLSFYFLVRIVTLPALRNFVLFGLACAGAMATKYTGLLCLFGFVCIWSFYWNKELERRELFKLSSVSIISLAVGFVLLNPYMFLNFSEFLDGFKFEKKHMLEGHSGMLTGAWSMLWHYHIKESLIPGMTWPVYLVSFFSLVFLAVKRVDFSIILLSYFLLFYLPAEWVKAKPAPQPERYVLPCVVFLIFALSYFFSFLKKSNIKLAVFLVILLAVPWARSMYLMNDLHPDTREKSANWIEKNIDRSKLIAFAGFGYHPNIQLEKYRTKFIQIDRFPWRVSPERLKRAKVDYLIVSSLRTNRYSIEPGNYKVDDYLKAVRAEFEVLQTFEAFSGTYGFHNPKIEIFKIR